jgi:hypothetical protein
VIISENFNTTWLPEGWTVIDGPGSSYYSHWFHRDNSYATVFVTGDNQDEWLISPEFSLPAAGDLRLSIDMMGSFYRMVTIDEGDFYVNVSNDNGASWETIWKEDDEAMVTASSVPWPYGSNEWFFPSISLNDYAGQDIQIAFRYVAPTGDADWWNLDNFVVKSLLTDDVALQKFEFPEYGVISDAFSFDGEFKNLGNNEVTSFEVVYSVNGVESDPYMQDNLSIAHNETHSFTHDIPFTFMAAEIYDLSLRVTQVNGNDDPAPDNNILYRDISIATEMLDRKPMFEVFTSSTCSTCPGANEQIDEVLGNNTGNYSLVKYQVYWPGAGDPYYIVDDSIRSEYYNVGGVPDFYSNGVYDNGFTFNQTKFNAAAAEGAFSNLEMFYYFNGTEVTVMLDFTPTINILDAAVHIAIVEKTTYNNVGTNGETEFHNVLMKMIPGPEGTPLGLEEGVAVNITEAASLEDTFIEEFDDLQVVVWIQDNETKYVLQSESSDLIVGIPENDERATFSFYPNPASHAIHIQSGYQAELVILDSQGRNVLTRQISRGQNTIDISNLKKGLYVIQMISEQMIKSQKLIVD